MRKILFTILTMTVAQVAISQSTYYWVGGANPVAIQSNANWNTSLDGSGSSRTSSTNPDVLIFNGTNIGGATPTTGLVSGPIDGGISCAQIKFINGANVRLGRTNSGTGLLNILGDGDASTEDFVIESGASLLLQSASSSLRISMAAANKGRVSGNFSMILPNQARIDNTTTGTGTLRFTSGSTFTSEITGSSSYAFGSNSQSAPRWVIFEAGSHLYYNGGNSPHGSGSNFSAIDMQPGSVWHHRGNNAGLAGNFFNRQFYGDISIENGATLTASNSIYRAGNFSLEAGTSFVPYSGGQTVVYGNLTANGNIVFTTGGNNRLVLAGSTTQTISGTGNIHVGSVVIGNNADVVLDKNITVEGNTDVYGKINFKNNQLAGPGNFTANGITTPLAATGNTITGNAFITGNTVYTTGTLGQLITGPGIAANTNIVAFSSTTDTVYLSKAVTATASGIALSATSTGATLATSNTNGFDAATGSVTVSGNQSFEDNINYIINGATAKPFGVSTGSSGNTAITGFTDINASITANRNVSVSQHLGINGKFILRPLDTLHVLSGANITGTFGPANYIAAGYNTGAGTQAYIQYDGLAATATIPIGTANNYMPVIITPATNSNFGINIFEGITINGQITGTPFTTLQQQTVVNAVWNISRLTGSGNVVLSFGWSSALEGTAFATLPGTDIGVIQNNGALWSAPLATGDNLNNTAAATVSTLGSFSIGAVAQVDPFVFNNLPVKTYGDADFNGGATSLNTSQPIVYSSDNAAVATIVSGAIHITGAGTANITASQASDGFYPAASVTKALTVNKAALIITADDKTKFEGLPNPVLTATYSGFVLSETPAALLTPAVLATTAVQASAPGTYPITVSGATSNNYAISFVDGVLTVQPKQNQTITFNALTARNYGNADFALNATSTNTTIPIVYSSSNTAVATVTGSTVHIVGAGTTDITASQAGNDGYFPAANVVQTLTVNKVMLTVRVRDTVKVENTPNPDFVMTYTGFVLGETAANLTTAPVISTIATTTSSPGYYTLTPGNGVSENYNFTYTAGRLTILPASDTTQQYLYAFVNGAGNLNVRTYSPKPTLADVYLYDMNGRLLRKKNLFIPRGFINTEINITTIPNGVYAIAVKGNGVDLKKTISIVR